MSEVSILVSCSLPFSAFLLYKFSHTPILVKTFLVNITAQGNIPFILWFLGLQYKPGHFSSVTFPVEWNLCRLEC